MTLAAQYAVGRGANVRSMSPPKSSSRSMASVMSPSRLPTDQRWQRRRALMFQSVATTSAPTPVQITCMAGKPWMNTTPATSAMAPTIASASGPIRPCSRRPTQKPHSAMASEANMSGQRIASFLRNPSPTADNPARMNGVPAQQSAAKMAPRTPPLSASRTRAGVGVLPARAGVTGRSRSELPISCCSNHWCPAGSVDTTRSRTSRRRSSPRVSDGEARGSRCTRGRRCRHLSACPALLRARSGGSAVRSGAGSRSCSNLPSVPMSVGHALRWWMHSISDAAIANARTRTGMGCPTSS